MLILIPQKWWDYYFVGLHSVLTSQYICELNWLDCINSSAPSPKILLFCCILTPFKLSWNGVILVGSVYIRPITKCTIMYSEQTAGPKVANFFPNKCTLARYYRLPIFVQIVDVLDLLFKRHIFESSTRGSSKVIISQTLTDRTKLILSTHRKSHVTFGLAYLNLTLVQSKGLGQGRAHFYY